MTQIHFTLFIFCFALQIKGQDFTEIQDRTIFFNDSLMKIGMKAETIARKTALFTEANQHILQNQAEAIAQVGKFHPYYFQITHQAAHVLHHLEKYDSSIILLRQLEQLIRQTTHKDSLIYGEIFNTIGINYRKLRLYKESEAAYLFALNHLETFKPFKRAHDRSNYATRLQNLAVLYFDMGKMDASIEFGHKTLAYTTPNTNAFWARTNTLALSYKRKGRFKEALQMAQMVLNQTDTKNEYYPIRLISVATIYSGIQLYDKALELELMALKSIEEMYGKKSYFYGNINNNLSVLSLKMGQDSLALAYAQEACRVGALLDNQINYNQYLCQLANCYNRLGETDKALELAEKSVQYLVANGAKQAEPYFHSAEILTRIYQKKGLLEKAIALNESTIDLFQAVWDKTEDQCLSSTMRLIQLYQNNRQFDKSVALLKSLAHTMNTQIIYNLDVLDEESKTLFINKSVKEYHHLLLSQLQNTQKKDSSLVRAAYQAELAMKGVVLGSTQLFRQIIRQSQDATAQKWDKQRIALNQKIEKAYSQQVDSKYVDSLKTVLQIIEANLMTVMPELKTIQRQTIDFDSIRAALPVNSCAIEFTHFRYYDTKSWTDSVLYGAILIRSNQAQPEWVSLCNEKQLYDLLKSNANPAQLYATRGKKRGRKRGINPTEEPILPSVALYELLWKPLEAHLAEVKTVYYAPSGLLHRIAYAALKVNELDLLSDKYDLHAVSSTRNVVSERAQFAKPLIFNDKNSILIYGGIQYDADSLALLEASNLPTQANLAQVQSRLLAQRGKVEDSLWKTAWTYLSGTKWELERVTTLFKKKNIIPDAKMGFAASESDFKKQQYHEFSPHVIHFATHGFFYQKPAKSLQQSFQSSANPLIRSGLVMAGANQVWMGNKPFVGFEDGILTAYEISLMNLSNTKLVVLSACETGLGDIEGSEGVYGLQRAFKMAGVESVLMSLWQVPDKQTAELMEKFYTYLLENQSIQSAFAQAQQAMKAKYAPYFWAGFVLVQ